MVTVHGVIGGMPAALTHDGKPGGDELAVGLFNAKAAAYEGSPLGSAAVYAGRGGPAAQPYAAVALAWEVFDTVTSIEGAGELFREEVGSTTREKGYREDQPRVPAGSPEGGRWVSSGGYPDKPSRVVNDYRVFNSDGMSIEVFAKGPHIDDNEAVSLAKQAGALPGATVRIEPNVAWTSVVIDHPEYSARRLVHDHYIRNQGLTVDKAARGRGIGTEIVATQVAAAVAAGKKSIELEASATPGDNGYYTWPRLGYDAELEGQYLPTRVQRYATEHGLQRVSDFMKSPEHRAWWKENGAGFSASFDLAEGSLSRKVFDAYLEERRRRDAAHP